MICRSKIWAFRENTTAHFFMDGISVCGLFMISEEWRAAADHPNNCKKCLEYFKKKY